MQTENYIISYRHIPGALGTGCTLDNGAVMTASRRTRGAAEKAHAAYQADPTIQWVRVSKRGYGRIL